MATIEQNLQRLVNAKNAIASAIAAKGGTVAASDGFEEFATCIGTISEKSSNIKKDVNFYDYDGTIVDSYTAAEFANLTAMPKNPIHEGLTGQGWNWSLSDAKTYVASYGKLDIGQMYVTSDGKTRIYIELSEGRLSPYLKLYLNANSELDINWGDRSSHSTFTSTSAGNISEQHIYSNAGSYVITITVITGGFTFPSSSTSYSSISALLTNNNSSSSSPDCGYTNSIKKIEIGSSVTSIGVAAFKNCYSLSSITIPNSVTSIEESAFIICCSLSSVTIPSSVTWIEEHTFSSCYSLSSVTIPNSVMYIREGAFSNCYSLSSVTIPNSVTSLERSAFANCLGLISITIPSNVTSIASDTFKNCESLPSFTIPSSVKTISSNAFNNCYSLSSIIIPSSVTSIGNNAFSKCYSLATITIEKAEGSITGSPWGAITSSPTSTQIVWTG